VIGLDLRSNALAGSIPTSLKDLSGLESLYLNSNQLSGNIPSELGQLSGDVPAELENLTRLDDAGGLDLRWNALHSDDAALIAFLNTKQATGDWGSTQTIAPENIQASSPTSSSIVLDWTTITFEGESGGYAVFVDPLPPGEAVFFDGFESNDTKWWGLGMTKWGSLPGSG